MTIWLVLFAFAICYVEANHKNGKIIQLARNQNRTVCINGETSIFKLWSYEKVTISANIGDPVFYVKSDDSSVLKSFLGLFSKTQYSSWNSRILYDVVRNEDRSIDIYLSPYRKSCIFLSNPYENTEYPLKVNITVHRSSYWLYPVVITASCLLFIYAKLLCFTSLFYYVLFMILSPLCIIPVLLSSVLHSLLAQSQWKSLIVGIHNSLLMSFIIRAVLRHNTHFIIQSIISDYCFFSFLISLFFVNQKLDTMKKKDIQLTYVMIRLGCLIAIMNSTASVCVSLVSLLFFIVIGVISNRLKPHHLIKELQILFQSDEVSSNLQLDQYQYQQVRNELYRLRSLLLENPTLLTSISRDYRTELDQFLHSPYLIFPSDLLLTQLNDIVNSPHTVSPNANAAETSTFLLDESGAEEPFFKNLHAHESTKSAFKKIMDSIKSTVAPEAPQPQPSVTYSMPFQPQANRYYETFKGVFQASNIRVPSL